jgi:hypothetical protein
LIPDNGSDSPYEPSLPEEGAGKDKQCVVLDEATSPRASDYHSDPDENDEDDDEEEEIFTSGNSGDTKSANVQDTGITIENHS